MKKLALILAVLLLFGGVAFASDVTVSGAVTHSFGFADGWYESGRNRANMNINAQVDAVNSLGVTFQYDDLGNRDIDTAAGIDPKKFGNQPLIENAHFTTNLGAALGLQGQTLTTRIGWYEAAGFVVGNVSGAADIERVRRAGRSQNVQLDYAFGSAVRVRTVLQPGDGDAMRGLVAVAGGFGPVQAEFVYTDIGKAVNADATKANDDGQVEVGLLYSDNLVPGTLSLRVGANFAYRLGANDAQKEMVWGVGVNAGLLDGLATLGIALNGDDDEAVQALGIRAIITPVAFAGFDFFTSLDLVDDNGPLSYLEASVYLKPGAATYRVGYAMRGDIVDGSTPPKSVAIGADRNAAGAVRNVAGEGNMFFAASLSY